MACAAALATLEFIEDEHLVEKSRSMGRWALERLQEMQGRRPHIRDVRGLGLLINVELSAADLAERVMYQALSRGLSFKVTMGNVITLAPPLIITHEEMARALEILEDSLIAAC